MYKRQEHDTLRLSVPGHNAQEQGSQRLSKFFGQRVLDLDIPPLLPGIDNGPNNPLEQSRQLAAEAWGAHRAWFLTNGASQANRLASLMLAQIGEPGQPVLAQRSAHSSFVDGIILAGLDPRWVLPTVDKHHGINHGVSPASFEAALKANPNVRGAYIISPSYFGAVADVEAIAKIAHNHGIPLIVDGAWGSHFGFNPDVPENPLKLGADLLVSSIHKLGGSLTQSAMLLAGKGEFAEQITAAIDRSYVLTQSTSNSALLLASLDIARSSLATGSDVIGRSVKAADRLRDLIRQHPTLKVVSDGFDQFDDILTHDPLHVSIDVSGLGRTGHEARAIMMTENHIELEISTDSCVVAIVGPGHEVDAERLVAALDSLQLDEPSEFKKHQLDLPAVGESKLLPREAYFAKSEVVDAKDAAGRISSDSLAAYPPGIPNVMPGEVISAETVEFLMHTAAAPAGYVRGAITPAADSFRVVAE